MRIGIACGGTGGHVFPGLATARVLRRRGHDVILWLAGKDVEQTAIAGWDGPVVTVHARGFSSGFSIRNASALWGLFRAFQTCRKTMKLHQPAVLLAMGSYASVGPALAARQSGIPLVLHESNVIPGRAIKLLHRWAAAVAIAFEETREFLRHERIVLTGMPLRESTEENNSGAWQAFEAGRFTMLIMGGSRGAHTLNIMASAAVTRLHKQGRKVQVIHLTGSADESRIRTDYEQAGVPHIVFGFLNDMAEAYQRTTLAVCRSGASTCAELSRYEVPALLVPYPFATHQHQLANARALEKSGSAHVRQESELSVDWIADYVSSHTADSTRLESMKKAAKIRNTGDAASLLADLVEMSV